jgi:RelA/SpoT family (p)ppGpp synthetase
VTTIDALADRLAGYLDEDKVRLVREAYECAKDAHEGQSRRSGEPYITHPLAVASILAELHLDHQTLMAALMHDVIEDTSVTKAELAARFGESVAELVDGVSKLTQIEFKSKAEAQARNFQKMTLAMAKDIRVILVKLADRLHNMRTLGPLHPSKRRRIAIETLDIYAPIANRLGINSVRVELEDLGFEALYPMRSKYIRKAIENLRGNHNQVIAEIKERLEKCLAGRGLSARIIGREKHLNSIYRKMKKKHKSFHEIMDVYAFRIVTETEDDCYRVLGAVHSLYKPLPTRFKDYIAVPKFNGYQSLHTTLFSMHVNIEIQIRTEEMEKMANYGVAAHWQYKDETGIALANQVRIDRWLDDLKELRERADDSMEFIKHAKIDLFPNEIYVFTPKGAIVELPHGATPIDFAYLIHTDIGNATVACRINKKLASLAEPLVSGQTVEIITAPGATPNPAWLDIAVTGRAQSGIRHFLKNKRQTESAELGRGLLDRSLAGLKKDWKDISDVQINRVLQHNNVDSLDELLQIVGQGKRMPFIIARQLVAEESALDLDEQLQDQDMPKVLIKGTEGMKVSYAHCCYPIPGDPIVGVIDENSGLVIHLEGCRKLLRRTDLADLMRLSWVKDITDEFVVELRVELKRQRGIIAELAAAVTRAEANLESISIAEQNAEMSVVNIIVHIRGRQHLARVMRRIRAMKAVLKVRRDTH